MIELNTIYNEDCLDTIKKLENNSVDLVITSPPYNLGNKSISGNLKKKSYNKYNDSLTIEQYLKKTKIWIDELLRITKYHIFWNIQEVSGNKGIIAFIMNEYKNNIKETFIWAKTNPPSHIVDTMCSSGYEYIFCISKDNPNSRKFNYCNFSNRKGDYIKNILIKNVNTGKDNGGHSFAFGSWLSDFFVYNFSKKNSIIYDPFMGSGTTALSCLKYNRKFIGSEISKEYCNIAEKRIIPEKNQIKIF